MLKWGILGTGFISRTKADAICASPSSKLEAVAGRDEARSLAFGKDYGCLKGYGGLEALLADSDVDIVYVSWPNHLHHKAVIACANAGKAVVSEKSLTTTMDDARALEKAVRTNGIFFMEGLMYLNHPVIAACGEIVRSGRLGTLRSIIGHYTADIWNVTNPDGLGTIFNLGCYPVSLMHFILQEAGHGSNLRHRKLTGSGFVNESDGVLNDAAMTMALPGNVTAQIQSSDSYGMSHSFEIHGDKASLRFVTNPWHPKAGANLMTLRNHNGDTETIEVHSDHDAFGHQVRTAERKIAEGALSPDRPSPRLQDSLEIMEILTDWYDCCRS